MTRVGVLGATSWGTVLAILFARRGSDTFLISRTEAEAETLQRERENSRRLPGIRFPDSLGMTSDYGVVRSLDLLVLAVPSAALAEGLERLAGVLGGETVVLSATKGVDAATGDRMTELVLRQGIRAENVLALSGPNFAAEIGAGLPAATVVAGPSREHARTVQDILGSDSFRVYTGDDIVGVEYGGALKNVAAIACGISDGLGFGDNANAAITTRAMAEITRLGVAAGAKAHTFLGLAGLGDLLATCTSDRSRNRRLGIELARGAALEDALASIGGVSEGAQTARAVPTLTARFGVEMPIATALHAVLYAGMKPADAVKQLMSRQQKAEDEGLNNV